MVRESRIRMIPPTRDSPVMSQGGEVSGRSFKANVVEGYDMEVALVGDARGGGRGAEGGGWACGVGGRGWGDMWVGWWGWELGVGLRGCVVGWCRRLDPGGAVAAGVERRRRH